MRILFTFLLAFGLMAGTALAGDPTGSWKAEMPGRDGGTFELTFNFKADGEKLTGNVSSQMGEREIKEGKVSGDDISFVMVFERDGEEIKIQYTGKMSGNEIKFTMQRPGSEMKREFTAKKV